jgi:uncharacterized protein YdeI (YjbR/CyaY-like superfamily)
MALPRLFLPMPTEVVAALDTADLRAAYDARPAFQRNDYLMWINKAARTETRDARLAQMLHQLGAGDVRMKMRWGPR